MAEEDKDNQDPIEDEKDDQDDSGSDDGDNDDDKSDDGGYDKDGGDDDEGDEDVEPEIRGGKKSEGKDKDDDGDGDLTDEDSQSIRKIVREEQGVLSDQIHNQTVASELRAEFEAHPEYKPYEKRIRAFVNHPNRKGMIQQGLPVSAVVAEAIAPKLQEIGAKMERVAKKKADKTRGGGSSSRPSSGKGLDWENMSTADFEKEKAKALQNASV